MKSSARARRAHWAGVAAAAFLVGTAADADETITYSYDALGRLIHVARAGTANNAASEDYQYDPAGNRKTVTVVGSAGACTGVSFTISSNGAVTEGASSVFTITKSGTTSSSCAVSYITANGSAVAGSDYTSNSGTLTFTSAQTQQNVSVATTDDVTPESAETFTMSLSAPTAGSSIGTPGSATATINDNDTTPCSGVTFTIASSGAVSEGATSIFTVTKSGTTSGSCSVNFATADGTAIAGSDYTANSGTLTFTSAQTQQNVNVATIDDAVAESVETFNMSLSSPSGGSVLGSPNSSTATINDNDAAGPTVINLPTGGSTNLRTVANANGYIGSSNASYTFVVGSGVTVTGSAGGGIGIDTGTWPTGVTLTLQVSASGIVRGGGGNGGKGGGVSGSSILHPVSGSAGGDAVKCNANIAITVASGGTIQAGGGGGGGGGVVGGASGSGPGGYSQVVPGGGGGGGAPNGAGGAGTIGYNTFTSSPGSPGTTAAGGAGGGGSGPAGGAGGAYATTGGTGVGANAAAGATGGVAGYAVRKNGTGCTLTNNGTVTGTVG